MSNRKYRTASLDGLAKLALRDPPWYYAADPLHKKWLKAGFVKLERIPWGSRNKTTIVITDKGWLALSQRARSRDTRFRLHGKLHIRARDIGRRGVDLHALNIIYENCSTNHMDQFYNKLIGLTVK